MSGSGSGSTESVCWCSARCGLWIRPVRGQTRWRRHVAGSGGPVPCLPADLEELRTDHEDDEGAQFFTGSTGPATTEEKDLVSGRSRGRRSCAGWRFVGRGGPVRNGFGALALAAVLEARTLQAGSKPRARERHVQPDVADTLTGNIADTFRRTNCPRNGLDVRSSDKAATVCRNLNRRNLFSEDSSSVRLLG